MAQHRAEGPGLRPVERRSPGRRSLLYLRGLAGWLGGVAILACSRGLLLRRDSLRRSGCGGINDRLAGDLS